METSICRDHVQKALWRMIQPQYMKAPRTRISCLAHHRPKTLTATSLTARVRNALPLPGCPTNNPVGPYRQGGSSVRGGERGARESRSATTPSKISGLQHNI